MFPIQVLQSEAFDSTAVKKKLAQFCVWMAKILEVLLSPQNQHRQSTVLGLQGNLTEVLGAIIDFDVIYTIHPTSLCTIHAAGNQFWNSDDL
jgi:hypothetical protein